MRKYLNAYPLRNGRKEVRAFLELEGKNKEIGHALYSLFLECLERYEGNTLGERG